MPPRVVLAAVEDVILDLKGLEEAKRGSEVGILFSQLLHLKGDLRALETYEMHARHSSKYGSSEIQTDWFSYLRPPPS